MRKKNILLLIVFAGVLLRSGVVFFSSVPYSRVIPDLKKYDHIAQNIAFKGIYSQDSPQTLKPEPTAVYPPVYPGLLAAIYRFCGYKPILAVYLNIIFYITACMVIFKLGRLLFDETTGLIGVLFFTLEPVVLIYSIIPIPDICIGLLLPLSLYFLIKFLNQNPRGKVYYRYLILANITLALGILTKPVVFYFPFLIVLFILSYWKKNMRKAVLASGLTLILTGLAISPWLVRNYRIWNKVRFVTTGGFIAPRKSAILEKVNRTQGQLRDHPSALMNRTVAYVFGTGTITFYRMFDPGDNLQEYYQRHKEQFLKKAGSKRHNIFKGPLISDYLRIFNFSRKFAVLEFLFLGILLITYLFALLGVFFAFKFRKRRELLVAALGIIYFSATIIVAISANSRYRLPAIPFYAILAGYGVKNLVFPRNKNRV